MPFSPNFSISPATAKALMAIEASRTAVDGLPISPLLIASLRESARLLSTHYSTQIEGNRLTLPEVRQVIAGHGGFPGRERDEKEVRNYYLAADKAEAVAMLQRRLTEKDIQMLHGLAFEGTLKPTPYRDGQNVIRNSADNRIVYMPPEAREVPTLMRELLDWINEEIEEQRLPVPVIAALAHYQFATIHPYYDGNGRTSRLLATTILHRCGYGLKGIYSLEEYYARHLRRYYDALSVGSSHNYHLGRAEADVSGFVHYFCEGMADAFLKVRARAETFGGDARGGVESLMRELRPLQRQALGLFAQSRVVTAGELAKYLGISQRQGAEFCATWARDGFLVVENPSKKARSYRLAQRYEVGAA
ncbi:Fic family protein [Prosthecobacter sp.]|uniref:Fic family protein n=1 Tax=Prosthecobacter sp. TaxID=1965333 RepID=UPI003784AFB0